MPPHSARKSVCAMYRVSMAERGWGQQALSSGVGHGGCQGGVWMLELFEALYKTTAPYIHQDSPNLVLIFWQSYLV